MISPTIFRTCKAHSQKRWELSGPEKANHLAELVWRLSIQIDVGYIVKSPQLISQVVGSRCLSSLLIDSDRQIQADLPSFQCQVFIADTGPLLDRERAAWLCANVFWVLFNQLLEYFLAIPYSIIFTHHWSPLVATVGVQIHLGLITLPNTGIENGSFGDSEHYFHASVTGRDLFELVWTQLYPGLHSNGQGLIMVNHEKSWKIPISMG